MAQNRILPPLFDFHTVRVVTTLLATGAVLGFIYLARRTLLVFLFAILFAYLLEPIIPRLQRWLRLSRVWAIAVLYAGIGIGFLVFIFVYGPHLAQQAEHMSEVISGLTQRLKSGQIAQQLGQEHGWSQATQARLQHFTASHSQLFVELERQIAGYATSAARNALWILLIPILAIFFLKDGRRYGAALVELANRRNLQELLESVLSDLHQVMAHYIRAQLILTLLGTGVFLIGFWLLGLPYPIALGTIVGLLEFIPVVGPLIGFVLVGSVALLTNYQHWVALALLMGGFRLEQDYVNSPHIMGTQVKLPPLAVLFGVIAGAELAGVLGVYLSVPVLASLRVLWEHWRHQQQLIP